MDNIKPDAMEHQAKLNKNYTPAYILFQVLKQSLILKVRDCRQITFVTLKRFSPLSKPPCPHPLFLTNNIKMDRIPTKIK